MCQSTFYVDVSTYVLQEAVVCNETETKETDEKKLRFTLEALNSKDPFLSEVIFVVVLCQFHQHP